MKIALMQMNIVWEDKEKNLAKAEELIKKAQIWECEVAVFPEMFSTGFSMENSKISEDDKGMVLSRLCLMARKSRISIIAGIAVKTEDNFENRAYIINSKGEIQDFYTKNYGFSYSGEDKKYNSGDSQITFNLNGVSSSVFICYDLRFPELFRKVARSVSLIFVIANWPDSRIEQWDTLLKARAIENQCFVVAVNRKGSDNYGLNYNGHSQVINPSGEEVDLYRIDGECRCFEIDEGETAFVRERFPFLKDYKG
jgi:omega-amidase